MIFNGENIFNNILIIFDELMREETCAKKWRFDTG